MEKNDITPKNMYFEISVIPVKNLDSGTYHTSIYFTIFYPLEFEESYHFNITIYALNDDGTLGPNLLTSSLHTINIRCFDVAFLNYQ